MKQPDWTIKDVRLLKEHYYSATTEELLEMFENRTALGIYGKAVTLRLSGRERTKNGLQPIYKTKDNATR